MVLQLILKTFIDKQSILFETSLLDKNTFKFKYTEKQLYR